MHHFAFQKSHSISISYSKLTWNDKVILNDPRKGMRFIIVYWAFSLISLPLSVLPRASLFIPWVCCMTLIASSSPLLPFSSLYSKSQSLTNTFNIPETPRASLSQDEVKAETIRNLRKSFASLFSDWDSISPSFPLLLKEKETGKLKDRPLLPPPNKDQPDAVFNSCTLSLMWKCTHLIATAYMV